MTSTPHFKHPSLLPPSPSTTPSPPPKNFDRTLAGFDWTLWLQSIMGSPVIESTSSCPGHLSGVPTVLQSTSSCPKYLRLSRVPLVVESTSICREHLQLSKVPPVVQSTSSCWEYLQLSRASPVVQSTSICREHLQLSKVPSSSCWEHHQSEVSPYVSQEHEQLSKVPSVIEGTSNSRKYLRLLGAVIRSTLSCQGDLHQSEVSPSARSTSSCPKYLHLSRAPPVVQSTFSVVESDICQTGSAIIFPNSQKGSDLWQTAV